MGAFLQQLFDAEYFMPHGHCYLWRPDILWLHVVSDTIIGLAYASIPFALVYLVRKRKDLAYNWVFIMFGVFILACGATHFLEVWTVWKPIYATEGIVKGITALASIGTAIALWPLLPKVLVLPSPSQLAEANQGLHLEIAERQKAEAALEERNAALVEAERLKSEFLANVSHELRTPLTLILAPIESMLTNINEEQLTPLQKKNLHTVHNNSLRLLQMVNSLLDFSKLEANKIEVKREPTEIVGATQAILTDFEPIMAAKNLELALEADLVSPVVQIDRYLYERILFNLLSNAIKFTPEGGSVTVRLRQDGERFQVAVQDTGVGITQENKKHLFEKFRQIEGSATRRFEGSGLGLALVKEFSELLDGTVGVDSELDKGSTFTVDIMAPAASQDAIPKAERKSQLVVVPPSEVEDKRDVDDKKSIVANGQDNLPRVLIAEDNHELAAYIESVLRGICTVRWAKDGEQAFQQAKDWRPDLILSDVMMPKRDGVSLCRDLKADPDTKNTPVVLLTALTHREALLKGWEAGADEYLFKPFHPTELLTRIKTLLRVVQERKKAEEEAERYTVQLENANKELESFSYSVSHDLRAPLRAVDGFTRILIEDYSDEFTEEASGYLSRIRDNSEQMGRLIDDLLAFSRMSRAELRRIPVNMNAVLDDVLNLLKDEINGRNIKWQRTVLPEVEADPTMMKLVFQNLLSNAIKYTGPRKEAMIEIGCKVKGEWYEFFVRDNGVGFDMQYQDKLFGVFQRLHGSDEFEGTGIGLASVMRIVSRHGGQVWAEGEVDKGASFYFSLPRNQTTSET